jgi:hypothetical protein
MLHSFVCCHRRLVGCVADAEALRLEVCAQHCKVLCPVVPAHTLQCQTTSRGAQQKQDAQPVLQLYAGRMCRISFKNMESTVQR